ncbi:MAG TPA: hypothetical protein PKI46_06205, partial [Bacteroidales bacterium]|nr:hypothetical protein [Bacteroidales bacterium]
FQYKTFPQYTGKKFILEILDSNTEVSTVSYWDGGSKDYYAVVDYEGNFNGSSNQYHNIHPQVQEDKRPKWIANKFQVLINHSYFCGKDCGITIYATNDSLLLPKNLLETK